MAHLLCVICPPLILAILQPLASYICFGGFQIDVHAKPGRAVDEMTELVRADLQGKE